MWPVDLLSITLPSKINDVKQQTDIELSLIIPVTIFTQISVTLSSHK